MVMAAVSFATPTVFAVCSPASSSSSKASGLIASRRDQALFGSALKGSVMAVPGEKKQRREPIRAYTETAQPLTARDLNRTASLTLYDTLGIPNHVTLKEIKTAYREKARQYHPDVNPSSEEGECMRKFLEVQKAYGVLANPDLRARYDLTLLYGVPRRALQYGISSSGMERFGSEPKWGSQLTVTPNGLRDNSSMKMPSYTSDSGQVRFRCSYEMC